MQDFRSRIIGQSIDQGKDLATDLATKFIRDDDTRNLTNQIVADTAQSLHSLHKSRLSDQSISDTKNVQEGGISQKPKQGFFQKIGSFFKNLWGKVRQPAQGLISKIPFGIGNAANQIIDHLDPVKKPK